MDQIARAAVEAFLRDLELRQAEGESFEKEEMRREEATIELANRLGISEEQAEALWSKAEVELL